MKWSEIKEQLGKRESYFKAMCRNEEEIKQLENGIELMQNKIREIDRRLSMAIIEQDGKDDSSIIRKG